MAIACTCQQCGEAFAVPPSEIKNGRGKYCSVACQGLARRNKVECTCQQCGKAFTATPSQIKNGGGKYCERECYDLSRGGQVECTCEQCGKTFTSYPSQIEKGNGKYCSRACYDFAKRGENSPFWRGGKVECTCEQCGKVFDVNPSQIENGGGKYCSYACYGLAISQTRRGENHPGWRGGQVECKCQKCGKAFTAYSSVIKKGKGKYCSVACSAIAISQNKRGENNHLWRGGHSRYRGPNWGQQRKLAYERDQGICQHCGKKSRKGKRKNAVHHIIRFDYFEGDYLTANQLTNLITLCHQCHPAAEYGKIPIQPYLL